MNSRKPLIAGNWKMNNSLEEARTLTLAIREGLATGRTADVLLCVPALYLMEISRLAGPDIPVAAQNCSSYTSGAYTGEISAGQLASAGITHCILGHSERREYFGETAEVLKTKTDRCLEAGITPVFCVGEPKEVREAGKQQEWVARQIETSLFHLTAGEFGKLILAYEPIWAIGTGLTASSAQAQEMHVFIRSMVADRYGSPTADAVRILYGGSVKASNAAELFAMPDIDGGLVGGASLVASEFLGIVACA